MKAIKIIKKYYKIRMSPWITDTAITFYLGLDTLNRTRMMKEYQDYIDGVKNGTIIPTQPTLPKIPKL